MKDGLYIGKTGLMTLYIGGIKMNLVHIPIFSKDSTHAIVSYTPGEPGVNEELHDEVPIFRS